MIPVKVDADFNNVSNALLVDIDKGSNFETNIKDLNKRDGGNKTCKKFVSGENTCGEKTIQIMKTQEM